jgi:hypothetical protein
MATGKSDDPPLGIAIGLQIVSVAQLLSVNSLFLSSYNSSVVIFLVGLVLVSLGVATTVFLQIIWAMNETAKP